MRAAQKGLKMSRIHPFGHHNWKRIIFENFAWGYWRPKCTNFGAFGGLLGAVRGHIVELEGPRGPFSTWKSGCMCRVATISLHLAVFSRF